MCSYTKMSDIKVKEQTIENMMRGRAIYEPPRYMTVTEAANQLMEVVENSTDGGNCHLFDID